MLVSYPLCAVYHESTKQLQYIECPDLKMKFFLDEVTSKLSLAKITQEVEKQIASHLTQMQAAGLAIELPRDLSYYRQHRDEKNRFWFEQSLSVPDNRGIAERILPIGGFLLSAAAGSLVLFMVLASSELTFRRFGRVGSLLVGLVSALNTFMLMLIGYFLLGGREIAVALGGYIDGLFKKTADKEEILRIIAVKPEVVEEKALVVRTELQDVGEEEREAAALAETQSLSWCSTLFKYTATAGVSGLFLVDVGLKSVTAYQVLYRVGSAAFSPMLSEWTLMVLAGISAGIFLLDGSVVLSGMLFKVAGDLHDYLLSKEQAQKALKAKEKPEASELAAAVSFFKPSSAGREQTKSMVVIEELETDEIHPALPANTV